MVKDVSAKVTISIPSKLLSKIDKIKNTPYWKGKRSRVIVYAIKKLIKEEEVI